MDFNKLILSLLMLLGLSACSGPASIKLEGNLIGTALKDISDLSKSDQSDAENVAVFDETTRKIHVFRLVDLQLLNSYSPPKPDGKHVVLAHENGNYVIDFCEKSLTIFSKSGQVQKDPVQFMGQPLSAAFDSDSGLLIMYDDANTVAFLKMNESGIVTQQWSAGPQVLSGKTITSGELLPNGKLILGLSDKSVGVVDVAQTLAQKKWIFTSFASGLNKPISWVASVRDNPDQIFVSAGLQLALLNVVSQSLVVSETLTDESIIKLSKSTQGHLITRTSSEYDTITMYYPEASQIQSRRLQKQDAAILSSHLNKGLDRWSIVESANSYTQYVGNDSNIAKTNRTLKSFRLSDLLAQQKIQVADKAQAVLSPNYLFLLYPSELGYASRMNILSEELKEAKFFNVGHIGK